MEANSRRWLVAFALVTGWILEARIAIPAESSGGFSNANLHGTYVFRVSGSSLFTSPNELTSPPGFLASIGLISFDGQGLLKGSVSNSATRTKVIPAGRYQTPYSSQILCNPKMSGTYTSDGDGTGRLEPAFTSARESRDKLAGSTSTPLYALLIARDSVQLRFDPPNDRL